MRSGRATTTSERASERGKKAEGEGSGAQRENDDRRERRGGGEGGTHTYTLCAVLHCIAATKCSYKMAKRSEE